MKGSSTAMQPMISSTRAICASRLGLSSAIMSRPLESSLSAWRMPSAVPLSGGNRFERRGGFALVVAEGQQRV